jgi:hypothetical protein
MSSGQSESGKSGGEQAESIDYGKSQADVTKAKDKAHDEDAKRLAEEHGIES